MKIASIPGMDRVGEIGEEIHGEGRDDRHGAGEVDMFPFRMKTKNLSAYESLFLKHADELFGMSLRITHNKEEAEDLVQETAYRSLRSFSSFEKGTNGRAWLFKILINCFINRRRRRKKEQEILSANGEDSATPLLVSTRSIRRFQNPEKHFFDKLLSDDVVRALETLPEEFRTVVVLADLEGFSYKEIAEIVGCPVGTVMSRLHRGRRRLRSHLEALASTHGINTGKELKRSA